MKKIFDQIVEKLTSDAGILTLMLLISILLIWFLGFGCDSGSALAVVAVGGVAGSGRHVTDGPLTTTVVNNESPDLLRNEIDERIVKIRPMSTPLDQISRYGGSRLCGSMKVDYYSVDTKPVSAVVEADLEADMRLDDGTAQVKTSNNHIFEPSTTVMVPSVLVNGSPAVLYVVDCDTAKGVHFKSVNYTEKVNGEDRLVVPEMLEGTTLVRMGRAAKELDVQTTSYQALPVKASNLCQIFKAQIEQSTLVKISNKEVGWSFNDQEEAAIIDMRMGMEKNFLFGHKCQFEHPETHDDILLTGGIWTQTDNTFEYTSLKTEADLIALCKQAFTHNAGSSRKILLAGTGLIEQLHAIDHSRVLSAEQTVTKWGLDFTEIHSKFGTLYVLLSEVFDQCEMPDGGMVIDPEYITKYCHIPFRSERLNLRASGVRNTDAIVITEASCLVLRYPRSHMRIVRKG